MLRNNILLKNSSCNFSISDSQNDKGPLLHGCGLWEDLEMILLICTAACGPLFKYTICICICISD